MQFNYFFFGPETEGERDGAVSAPLFLLRLKADGRIQHLSVHGEKKSTGFPMVHCIVLGTLLIVWLN